MSILLAALLAPLSTSSTPNKRAFEEIIHGADFIGLVRCVTAGGIVARYKVIDSWKGPAAGSLLTIGHVDLNWGTQFPIVLVGEERLVAGWRGLAPDPDSLQLMGNAMPMWWRRIPAEFGLLPTQGRATLPLTSSPARAQFGTEITDLAALRAAVSAFLHLDPATQELRALQSAARACLFQEDGVIDAALDERIAKASTTGALVDLLLAYAGDSSDDLAAGRVAMALARAHGPTVRTILEGIPAAESPLGPLLRGNALRRLRRSTGAQSANDGSLPSTEPPAPATAQELDALCDVLREGSQSSRFQSALRRLTALRPEAVADWLAAFDPASHSDHGDALAYDVSAYFAVHCEGDRAEWLRRLGSARHDLVRVAGGYEGKLWTELQRRRRTLVDESITTALTRGRYATWTRVRIGHMRCQGRASETC